MPASFESFIASLQLKFFKPDEFLVATERPGNEPPPARLWPNICATALVLDRVRKHFGRATVITSCYRSEVYNRQVGGVARSNHKAFTAVDFGVAGVSPPAVAALLRSWRGEWFAAPLKFERVQLELPDGGSVPFAELAWRDGAAGPEFQLAGGVGEYSRFTHLDTRGLNHTWSGN